MLREFPSTPEEAFFASTESSYYAKEIVKTKQEGRITKVTHDVYLDCYTSWDLGIGDASAIWIFQVIKQEIHLIDYIEDSGKPLTHYIKLLKDLPYTFEKHFVPHDAGARELSSGLSRAEVAQNLGMTFTIVSRLSVQEGIDAVKNILSRCWFDETKCAKGLLALESYKKKWNKSRGCWDEKPLHDNASHGADAFRMLAISIKQTTKGMTKEELIRLKHEAGRHV